MKEKNDFVSSFCQFMVMMVLASISLGIILLIAALVVVVWNAVL
jgi:hypothetical protein